ncbi:MAG: RapZ C-terminal domain-containing protein [Candidatus Dormibacteraceae bacterium]
MAGRIVLGGPEARGVAPLFRDAGCQVEVLGASGGAARLRALDAAGAHYHLIHVGADDGEVGGSYERAHDRIVGADAASVADRVRPRERPRLRFLAFGYRQGLPEEATWLVDVRFLKNPYWVPELRPLTGLDRAVRDYVLDQPAASELLGRLESDLRWAAPRYQRDQLTVALGCTGGRHRSVAMAAELARRLADLEGFDVDFEAPELQSR